MKVFLCSPVLATTSNNEAQIKTSLEKISEKDPQYKWAIEELLKISYKTNDWPTFFSYAQYYRKHFSEKDVSEVQLLELIALLRHCQNDLLKFLIERLRKLTKKFSASLDQIEALSKTHFQGKKTSGELKTLSAHFEGETLWKTNHTQVGKFHPSLLKIKVENLCY